MKRLNKIFSLTAAVTLGLASLMASTPTQAATFAHTTDCVSGGINETVNASSGDVIALTVSAGTCDYVSVDKNIIASAAAVTVIGGGSPSANDGGTYWEWVGSSAITQVNITLTISSPGQINFNSGNPNYTGRAFNVSSGGSGGGSATESDISLAPAPVIQQFGKSASGTCYETQPDGLDWSGVSSGGWSESWAQWVNNGSGGAVCTRNLAYSTQQSKWVIG